MWFLLAIFSAFFVAIQFALIKHFLKKINVFVLAAGISLSAAFFLMIIAMLQGLPEIKNGFYYAMIGSAVLNFFSTTLYYKALKIIDLSIATPLTSFTPIFLIITSFLMLGEVPSLVGMGGIFLIVFGYYILSLKKNTNNKYEKITVKSFNSRGVWYMLAVAFLYSISSNFDKLAVKNSDPVFGSAMVALLLGLLFAFVAILKKNEVRIKFRENINKFLLVGAISALSMVAINTAMLIQIVPYVISIKNISILFSVLIGIIVFKEKNAKEKIWGAVIMLAGVMLIVLYK